MLTISDVFSDVSYIKVEWCAIKFETPLEEADWNLGPTSHIVYKLGGRGGSWSSFPKDLLRLCLPPSYRSLGIGFCKGELIYRFQLCTRPWTLLIRVAAVCCTTCWLCEVWEAFWNWNKRWIYAMLLSGASLNGIHHGIALPILVVPFCEGASVSKRFCCVLSFQAHIQSPPSVNTQENFVFADAKPKRWRSAVEIFVVWYWSQHFLSLTYKSCTFLFSMKHGLLMCIKHVLYCRLWWQACLKSRARCSSILLKVPTFSIFWWGFINREIGDILRTNWEYALWVNYSEKVGLILSIFNRR